MKRKMRIYEAMICDESKILVRLPLRTRLTLKELRGRLRFDIRRGDTIDGLETKDDFE